MYIINHAYKPELIHYRQQLHSLLDYYHIITFMTHVRNNEAVWNSCCDIGAPSCDNLLELRSIPGYYPKMQALCGHKR